MAEDMNGRKLLQCAMKVCWTSHEWANEKGNDTVIFEFYKPKLKFNKR